MTIKYSFCRKIHKINATPHGKLQQHYTNTYKRPFSRLTWLKCLCTSWNCANQSQLSHHSNISDPPPDSFWSYRATDSAFMADGLPVWLARRSDIPYRTACGIRLLAGTVSDNLWRRFCLQCTDAFSVLEVSWQCTIWIDFLLTYLLDY